MRANTPADTTLELRTIVIKRFEVESPQKLLRPMRNLIVVRRLTYEAAELYATNSSPRDRMRLDAWSKGEESRTLPYTRIDPRLR